MSTSFNASFTPHLAKLMVETALQMSLGCQAETEITISRPKEATEWIEF